MVVVLFSTGGINRALIRFAKVHFFLPSKVKQPTPHTHTHVNLHVCMHLHMHTEQGDPETGGFKWPRMGPPIISD